MNQSSYIRAYEVGVKLAQLEFRNKLAKPTKKELLDFEASQDETHLKPKAVRAGIAELREPELPKGKPTMNDLVEFEDRQDERRQDPKWGDLNALKEVLRPRPQRLRKNWEEKTVPTKVKYREKNESYPYSTKPEYWAQIPKPNLMAGVRKGSDLEGRQKSRLSDHYIRDLGKEMGKHREAAEAPRAKERWGHKLDVAAFNESLK